MMAVTTQANKIVGKVHDPKLRMPVILDDYNERLWLDKKLSSTPLLSLCKPYPDENIYKLLQNFSI
jgi:putative SOS response-associated peptidase YedK